jgi:hypothetical protein
MYVMIVLDDDVVPLHGVYGSDKRSRPFFGSCIAFLPAEESELGFYRNLGTP